MGVLAEASWLEGIQAHTQRSPGPSGRWGSWAARALRTLICGCCGGKQPSRGCPEGCVRDWGVGWGQWHVEPPCLSSGPGQRSSACRERAKGCVPPVGLLENASDQSCFPHFSGMEPGKHLGRGSCHHQPVTRLSQCPSYNLRAQSRQGPYLCVGTVPGLRLPIKLAST